MRIILASAPCLAGTACTAAAEAGAFSCAPACLTLVVACLLRGVAGGCNLGKGGSESAKRGSWFDPSQLESFSSYEKRRPWEEQARMADRHGAELKRTFPPIR